MEEEKVAGGSLRSAVHPREARIRSEAAENELAHV